MNKLILRGIALTVTVMFLGLGCNYSSGADTNGNVDTFLERFKNQSADPGGTCESNFASIQIGTQIWMAENLNCDVRGVCYDYDSENCEKYGRLYTWEAANNVCPSGWHLPSDDEWTTLVNYVEIDGDCSNCAGARLKSTTGWESWGSHNGTDDYGNYATFPHT